MLPAAHPHISSLPWRGIGLLLQTCFYQRLRHLKGKPLSITPAAPQPWGLQPAVQFWQGLMGWWQELLLQPEAPKDVF